MSPELITILGVGVTVAGIVLNSQRIARQDIKELRADFGKRIDDLDGRLREVEHGLAKLEGLLEGLREAISGRSMSARGTDTAYDMAEEIDGVWHTRFLEKLREELPNIFWDREYDRLQITPGSELHKKVKDILFQVKMKEENPPPR